MSIFHRTIPPAGTANAIDQPQWAESHIVDSAGIAFSDGSTLASGNLTGDVTSVGAATTIARAYTTIIQGAAFNAPGRYRILATANFSLPLPTGGGDGDGVSFFITATTGSPVVTINASYKIPTTSAMPNPFTVANGTKTRLVVQYDATRAAWEVAQFIQGY